jgi:hypothetical protein
MSQQAVRPTTSRPTPRGTTHDAHGLAAPGGIGEIFRGWGLEPGSFQPWRRSRSDDLADPRRGRQQWEVDVEADPQGFGDGRELADGGVAPATL